MSANPASTANGTAAASSALTGKLIKASDIAAPFTREVRDLIKHRVEVLKKQPPRLIGILAKPYPPSIAYADWTRKACEDVGIRFDIWKTWDDEDSSNSSSSSSKPVSAEEVKEDYSLAADVEDLIIAANADDSVDGIMVYYPIFTGRQDTYLQQILDPRKDVEGLHFSYCWNMYHNVRWILPSQLGGAPGTMSEPPASYLQSNSFLLSSSANAASPSPILGTEPTAPPGFAKSILPCTPLAIVKCLETMGMYDLHLPYGDRLLGKTVTVINRSEVVGRPLAALLANDGARVLSVDIDNILEFSKRAVHERRSSAAGLQLKQSQGGQSHQASKDLPAVSETEAISAPEGAAIGAERRRRSKAVIAAQEKIAAGRLTSHHTIKACSKSLQECLAISDIVISGVPSASYKIKTEWIKEGATCINFSSDKNFEPDLRSRAAQFLPAIGKTTISMVQRNLMRLIQYKEDVQSSSS
ncbi:Methylenetetrahydrofolate dehydrogenase [NAD(+)] [Tilletia horrida]|uniref:Methylenetetrahydrofolate dehydrogenase [NAD(+)] n=1 Tax=Tilletia horrida TaxID=155126 RepID=A0AAN6GZJ3_9BASI|nr:Methylenetetrahydrofolate dehydrogenase [NAD(+)] [Tilletia horrida]KAK0556517.1 Methylenetetrahydrofolate dehydrogenase [NAD(+)] [Tilletia horrida]KAK0569340.1 Methylenetetrahydrofolate dehydrogenase [NAD(+)] [Tilletia horrida]